MARNKKTFEQVELTDISVKGQTLSRELYFDRIIEVNSTLLIPGDVADLQEIRRRKNAFEARPTHITKLSEDRTEPWCMHFRTCGGCSWQHVSYEAQLSYKGTILKKALAAHPQIGEPEAAVLPSPLSVRYRNKLEFSFSARRWFEQKSQAVSGDTVSEADKTRDARALGFFVPRQNNRVVDIQECFHQDVISDSIRNEVRRLAFEAGYSFHDPIKHEGLLRTLVIRISGSGEIMLMLVLYVDDQEAVQFLLGSLQRRFPEIHSLYYLINPKMNDAYGDCEAIHFAGEAAIFERLGDLRFRIGPLSFFQVNPRQTEQLYDLISEYAGLTGDELLFDLYTGTGSIALYLAGKARKVVGIEYVESAIEDAKVNATMNSIDNCEFFAGDMKDILTPSFIAEKGKPDVMVCDPPRAGMHPDVIQTIIDSKVERIVYVSCNPVSLGRDLSSLLQMYSVVRYRGVDMSPQTPHLETVMLLERKNIVPN